MAYFGPKSHWVLPWPGLTYMHGGYVAINTENTGGPPGADRPSVSNQMNGDAEVAIQAGNIANGITINFGKSPASNTGSSAIPSPRSNVVDRPELSGETVEALLHERNGDVVALVGLAGAGGFGKTTLAMAVCHDSRVNERFPNGVLWVTLGENIRGAELAEKINDVSARISGTRPPLTDPEQAGQRLGALLDQKHTLLVIDDVWHAFQLSPFLHGGQTSRRLVTTRVNDCLPSGTVSVKVDAMTTEQARGVLSEGLPTTNDKVWEPLLSHTGGWPVLLTLANRALHKYVQRGLSVADATKRVADRLATKGPNALDISNADERHFAVTYGDPPKHIRNLLVSHRRTGHLRC